MAVENERLRLICSDYTKQPFPARSFDKACAFNLRPFWQDGDSYLTLLAGQLKPKGKFYLFYQPPFNNTEALAQKAEQQLSSHHYTVEEVIIENMKPAPAFCIVCRRD